MCSVSLILLLPSYHGNIKRREESAEWGTSSSIMDARRWYDNISINIYRMPP